MTTVKIAAKPITKYRQWVLQDDAGHFYEPVRGSDEVVVGQHAFLAKKTNSHHYHGWEWEIWPIVVEEHPNYKDYPKYWYGGGRYLYVRVDKLPRTK